MRYFVALVALLCSFHTFAKEKKYPSLLWEITGENLEQPSYLYGTMHVSKKVAFHLGDSFFQALKSVDHVALESDPSYWLEYMFDSAYLEQNSSLYKLGIYHRDFYREAFGVQEAKRELLQASLNFNSGMMNGILYRNSTYNADFEEDTYLDMYIYQTGRKWGKTMIGLEDFMESNLLVRMAQEPDPDEDEDELYREYRKLIRQGKDPSEMLEDAYRNGDLDMVDSIQFILNPAKNHQRYMLHERNRIMADRMDSILHSGSTLFAGVGAAHLAGDSGMIEMLRAHGYKLRPVTRTINDISRETRNALEKTYVKQEFSNYRSADGWFSVDLPGTFYEMPEARNFKLYFYPEMDNGTTYSMMRFRHFGALLGQDANYMLERIDSILYESIAGKILKQERTTINGYPAFDVRNRTRKGNHERVLIVATPLELIIFKVSGTLEYLKDNDYLDNVFSSFRITASNSGTTLVGGAYFGFEAKLPGATLQDNSKEVLLTGYNEREYQSYDDEGSYYRLKRSSLHDRMYIEEDTFELSYIASKFQEKLRWEETRREFIAEPYPTLYTTCKDSGEYVFSKYLIRGPHYYQMIKRSKDSVVPVQFFSSLDFVQPEYIFETERVEDTALYYSALSPVKFVGWKAIDKRKKEEEDAEDKYGHDYQYRNYFVNESDERVFVLFERFGKYFYAPSYDSLWRKKMLFYTRTKSLVPSKTEISDDSTKYYVELRDTNSSRMVVVKMYTTGDRIVKLSVNTDTISGLSEFSRTFLNSLEMKDTSLSRAFFESKSDIWFDDLYGEDSLLTIYAIESVGDIHFEADQAPRAIKVFESFRHDEFKLEQRADLLTNFGTLKHPGMLPYLRAVYERAMDTASFQLAVLRALTKRGDKRSFALLNDLLFKEVPLVDESSVERLIALWSDKPDQYAELYPRILELSRYGEYKAPVLSFLKDLLDSGEINPRSYRMFKDIMLLEGKDNIKRIMRKTEQSENKNAFYHGYYSKDPDYEEILMAINRILLPYSAQKSVAEYYERALRLNNNELKIKTMVQLLSKECHVPDSLWSHFARKQETRHILFEELDEVGRLDHFPTEYTGQTELAEGMVLMARVLDVVDSFQFFKRIPAANKDGSGYIYLFKHWDKEDEEWKVDYVGILPSDSNELRADYDVKRWGIDFHSEEELDDDMKDVCEELLYKHRERVRKPRRSRY